MSHPAPPLSILDSNDEPVTAGDEITFAYGNGIPPVRVCAKVEEIEGHLWALSPGHNPSRCKLSELRDHVKIFYKL